MDKKENIIENRNKPRQKSMKYEKIYLG